MPCGQSKALGGSCQCLVPLRTSQSTPGSVPGLLAVSEELCCILSSGWGTGEENSHGEARVTKSTLLGALFTLPYGETVSTDRMGKKMYIFKN